MKRMIFAWTIAMFALAVPVFSSQHGGGPKPTTHASSNHGSSSTHGGSSTHASASHGGSTSHGSSATHGSSSTHGGSTHGHSTAAHGSSVKPSTSHGGGHGATKTTTASLTKVKPAKTAKVTKPAKAEHAETEHTAHAEAEHHETEHEGKKHARTTGTTTTGTTTTLTPVQQKLQRNTNLASKLQSRLPAGTDLNAAASGFRNLGQFVAAVNASNNHGIPFSELKTRMVDRNMSLGQAIKDARPAATESSKTHKTTGGH